MLDPAADESLPPGWALRLGILFMVHVLGMTHLLTVLAMAPVVRADLGLSATEFGFLVAAYSAAQGVCALPVGWFLDRVGVVRGLQLGTVGLILGSLILTQAEGFALAVCAMAVCGAGYSSINPATSKAILLWFPKRWRATAMGVKQTGVPVGGMVAAALGTLVLLLPWRSVTWIVVAITVCGLLMVLLLPRAARRGGGASGPSFLGAMREILRNRNLGVLNLSVCAYNLGQQNLFAYLTIFLREGLQASLPVASLCLGVAQAASAGGRIAWGMVSDRLLGGRRKPMLVALGVLGAALFALMAVLPPGTAVVIAVVVAILLGATITAYAGLLQTIVIESAPPSLVGAALGYNKILLAIGATVGPPMFGAIVDLSGGFALAWAATGGFVLAAALFLKGRFKE